MKFQISNKLLAILMVFSLSCTIFCTFAYAESDSDLAVTESDSVSLSDVVLLFTEPLRDQELHLQETSPADAVRATDYAQLIYNYLTSNIAPNQVSIYNELIGASTYPNSVSSLLKDLRDYTVGTNTSSSSLAIRDLLLLLCDFSFGSTASYQSGMLNSSLTSIVGNTGAAASYSYQSLAATNSVSTNIENLNKQFTLSAGEFQGLFYESQSNNNPVLVQIPSTSSYVNTNKDELHALFSFTAPLSNEAVYSVFIPCRRASNDPADYVFSIRFCSPQYLTTYNYYIQPDLRDIQVVKYGVVITFSLVNVPISNYLLDIFIGTRQDYNLYYYGYTSPYFYYIPQTDAHFADIYQYLQLKGISSNTAYLQNINNNLSDLSDYLTSDAKQAAEDASSAVIQETLDDFTGSGSAAAKISDSIALKDISYSLQGGFYAGGNISNATSIFASNSDFWKWFSQQNYNDINSMTFQQTRRSIDPGWELYNNSNIDWFGGDY